MLQLFVRVRFVLPQVVRRFLKEESGLSMIEYGIMAAAIIGLLAVLMITVGPQLKDFVGVGVCNLMNKTYNGGSKPFCT